MGRNNRHSKDRLFITATEWRQEYGGKKVQAVHGYQCLPFDHCALSLVPFETPVCTPEGVLFDSVNLISHVLKYKKNPVTGENMSASDIIHLNMAKNNEGLWHCPVTFKVFNNSSHIVAIRTTGNVYSYEAVEELNIKPKNYADLLTNEKFTRKDIICLQDPTNPEHLALRDVNNFKHLNDLREDSVSSTSSKIHHNPTTESIMKLIESKREEEEKSGKKSKALSEYTNIEEEDSSDVADILALKPTTEDINPGSVISEQRSGGALTSSTAGVWTSNNIRLATPDEIREARWRKMRQVR